MATTYIERVFTAGDNLKWTLSIWFKRGNISTLQNLSGFYSDVSYWTELQFGTDDKLTFLNQVAGSPGGQLTTNRLFRDPSAWMHVVAVYDSANVTAGDRMKLYINGVEETSFATDSNPTSSQTSRGNQSGDQCNIGEKGNGSNYFDGCMSHVQFVDGAALAPTEFGETDSTSGIWKIKTSAYGTPGTNGFYLKMEDRSNLDLDSSSNAFTDFTTYGTLTPTNDNPSNNFCVMNPLIGGWHGYGSLESYLNGNVTIKQSGNTEGYVSSPLGTLAMNTGKWYWENLIVATNNATYFGVTNTNWDMPSDACVGCGSYSYGYHAANGTTANVGSTNTVPYLTSTTGDYVMQALDLDNGKIWAGKNGSWMNSGDPTSGATGTGAYGTVVDGDGGFTIVTTPNLETSGWYYPSSGHYASGTGYIDLNFGNGVFGTTALTGTTYADDAGIGTFKYDPPTGFYAVCTKNIKAYAG